MDALVLARERERERVTLRRVFAAQFMLAQQQQEQLGDGLVKLNEILTEFAPPIINTSAALRENTWHLNLEQKIHENQRAKTREGESVAMGEDTPQTPLYL